MAHQGYCKSLLGKAALDRDLLVRVGEDDSLCLQPLNLTLRLTEILLSPSKTLLASQDLLGSRPFKDKAGGVGLIVCRGNEWRWWHVANRAWEGSLCNCRKG